ncbi:hypothetical protein [Corynebacterium flavescens]
MSSFLADTFDGSLYPLFTLAAELFAPLVKVADGLSDLLGLIA